MGESNTTARRARLRPVLTSKGETAAILNILQQRREPRLARERRQAQCIKDTRWIDRDRAIEIAIEAGIEHGVDHLRVALKQGVLCRWQHRQRWTLWKPIEQVTPLLAGHNPLDLENTNWKLVVHEQFWHEYLARQRPAERGQAPPRAAARVSQLDAPQDLEAGAASAGASGRPSNTTAHDEKLVDATEEQIREAINAVYKEQGDKRPNYFPAQN